jgi:hypothetical protein
MAFLDTESIKQDEQQLFRNCSISLDLQWRLYSDVKEQAKVQNQIAFSHIVLSITGLEFRSQIKNPFSKILPHCDSPPLWFVLPTNRW